MLDVRIDTDHDIKFKNGDFDIGKSDEQHQHHLLLANKGEYKEHPEVGVGIIDLLNNEQYTALMIESKKQLEYDGMQVDNIRFSDVDKLIIDGKYK